MKNARALQLVSICWEIISRMVINMNCMLMNFKTNYFSLQEEFYFEQF